MSDYDPVTKPFHYNAGTVECIDIIKETLGPEGFVYYCQGTLMKYNHRHRYKGNPVEDMEKAGIVSPMQSNGSREIISPNNND